MSEAPQHGTFCWNELMTSDIDKATSFYSELIGWKANEMPSSGEPYFVFKAGEKDAGGMMAITKEMGPIPPHWMAYITVDDVDGATKKVTDLGGKVHVQPTDIPNVGRFSVIEDPTGASVGLISFPRK